MSIPRFPTTASESASMLHRLDFHRDGREFALARHRPLARAAGFIRLVGERRS